eukprot:5786559-Heterocapsa_arctica.AAC.1
MTRSEILRSDKSLSQTLHLLDLPTASFIPQLGCLRILDSVKGKCPVGPWCFPPVVLATDYGIQQLLVD